MEAQKRTLAQIDAEIAATKESLKNVKGSDTEVYARIVGYYRAVRNWNKGKREEFDHRKMFALENTYEISGADNACECSAPVRLVKENIEPVTNALVSEVASWELFSKETCPNCPPVKAYMNDVAMSGTMIDVGTEAGFAEAAKKGVFASPTVIAYGKDGAEIARGHTVEELVSIFEPVAVRA